MSLKGETIEVRAKESEPVQARIFETSQLCVFGNVQITTQALREMLQRNIPVAFFSTGGWFCGAAKGMAHKNVELRQLQYATAAAPAKCLSIAAQMIVTKIRNSRTILMRNHPGLPQNCSERLARLAVAAGRAKKPESLLGIEGVAARLYYSHFSDLLKGKATASRGHEWAFDFNGRNRRPPLDPVNALLSYAYGLLTKDLMVTAWTVGFDPFLGFYHKPRYGRPALALDLMEEFRPIIADSVVISAVNNGIVGPDDFVRRGPAVALKDNARRKFIQAYERRLDTLVTHPLFGYRISYRRVLEVQVRLLGRFLYGEIDSYPGFRTR